MIIQSKQTKLGVPRPAILNGKTRKQAKPSLRPKKKTKVLQEAGVLLPTTILAAGMRLPTLRVVVEVAGTLEPRREETAAGTPVRMKVVAVADGMLVPTRPALLQPTANGEVKVALLQPRKKKRKTSREATQTTWPSWLRRNSPSAIPTYQPANPMRAPR